MSQLIIETDAIKKAALYFFAVVGIGTIVGLMAIGAVVHYSQQIQPVVVPAAATAPAPTPYPTVVQAPAYPTVMVFTVLSTTVANGHYSIYTTTGTTLYMSDFASWNALWPRSTYTATITGQDPNGAYYVGTINLLSAPVTYPQYYHYNLMYYQWDGHRVDPISWKETAGHRVTEGRPPTYRG